MSTGLKFDDESKAAAVAALDLDWVCREASWVERQLNPSREAPCHGTAGLYTENGAIAPVGPVKNGDVSGVNGHASSKRWAEGVVVEEI